MDGEDTTKPQMPMEGDDAAGTGDTAPADGGAADTAPDTGTGEGMMPEEQKPADPNAPAV